MAVYEFKTEEEAQTIDDPKYIWVDVNRFVVFTGADMPIDDSSAVDKVHMRQARLALLKTGLLDKVDALIALQPREVIIAWEYAVTVERNNPLVVQVMQVLEVSDEEIDALFRLAATF